MNAHYRFSIPWLAGRIWLFLLLLASLNAGAQKVVSITIDGPIQPAAADHLREGIRRAAEVNAECLLVKLNTPGGLLKSTRVMVSDILESPVPVVVYVSPGGAHAGSAGVFITMAAHVAAMAPGTNMGAAHPVSGQGSMDSVMSEKVTNDAAAFIRSIAEKRNRNLEWAEDAVRRSVSISETEAVENNIIDLVAKNESDLLRQIDGRKVKLAGDLETVISSADAEVEKLEMSWLRRLLNFISDPNVAYILLLLGIYGIIFEFYSPGIGFPGIVGGICLILAFYAMHTLPINYAGLALILFGVVLFILELSTPTNGLLSIGAIVSLTLGSLILIKPGSPLEWAKLSLGVVLPAIAASALFFLVIIGMGLRAQRRKVATGREGLMGETGTVVETLQPRGMILLQGELWQAETRSGATVPSQAHVRVVSVEGLKVWVEPIDHV